MLPSADFTTAKHKGIEKRQTYPLYYLAIPSESELIGGYIIDLVVLFDTVDDLEEVPARQIFRRQQLSQSFKTTPPQFFSTLINNDHFDSQLIITVDQFVYVQNVAPLYNEQDKQKLQQARKFKDLGWHQRWDDRDYWYKSAQLYIKQIVTPYIGQPYKRELNLLLQEQRWRFTVFEAFRPVHIESSDGGSSGGSTSRNVGRAASVSEEWVYRVVESTAVINLLPEVTKEQAFNIAVAVNELLISYVNNKGVFLYKPHFIDFRPLRPITITEVNKYSNDVVFAETADTETVEKALIKILEQLELPQNGLMRSVSIDTDQYYGDLPSDFISNANSSYLQGIDGVKAQIDTDVFSTLQT